LIKPHAVKHLLANTDDALCWKAHLNYFK